MNTTRGLEPRYVARHRRCLRHPYPGFPVVRYEFTDCDAFCWTRTPTIGMEANDDR